MLDCQFQMIKVLFSQEIGEYRIFAFCIFETDICLIKSKWHVREISLGQENNRNLFSVKIIMSMLYHV